MLAGHTQVPPIPNICVFTTNTFPFPSSQFPVPQSHMTRDEVGGGFIAVVERPRCVMRTKTRHRAHHRLRAGITRICCGYAGLRVCWSFLTVVLERVHSYSSHPIVAACSNGSNDTVVVVVVGSSRQQQQDCRYHKVIWQTNINSSVAVVLVVSRSVVVSSYTCCHSQGFNSISRTHTQTQMAAPPAPPAPPTAAVPPNTTTATSASSSLRASEPAPTAVYPRGVAPSPGAGAAPPTTSSTSGGASSKGGGGGVTIGDYVLTELIGTGSFAAVYKGYHVRDGGAVAVKAIPLARLEGGGGDGAAAALRGLETEIRLLRAIAHDNIVRLLDVQRSARYIFLVLEYCDGGDVARYLRLHGPLGEAGARHVLRQLAAGLSALWERHLIHRDIKPSNLLLATRGALDGGASPPPAVKLADFGFARHLEASALAETLCGSPLYMSPELLRMQPYDAKADLWSVGILLAEVLTGRPPFWGRTPLELLHVIERSAWAAAVSPPVGPDAATCGGILPPAVAAAVSPACKDLLWRLLRRNPVTRISFDAFFAHPWLQDGDSPGRPLGPAGGEAVADGRRSATPIGQLPTTAADSFERRSGGRHCRCRHALAPRRRACRRWAAVGTPVTVEWRRQRGRCEPPATTWLTLWWWMTPISGRRTYVVAAPLPVAAAAVRRMRWKASSLTHAPHSLPRPLRRWQARRWLAALAAHSLLRRALAWT